MMKEEETPLFIMAEKGGYIPPPPTSTPGFSSTLGKTDKITFGQCCVFINPITINNKFECECWALFSLTITPTSCRLIMYVSQLAKNKIEKVMIQIFQWKFYI